MEQTSTQLKTETENVVIKKSAVNLRPSYLTGALFIIISFLLILDLSVLYLTKIANVPESGISKMLIKYFDFRQEGNIPTLFSSIQLFISSILLYVIYVLETHTNKCWLILSLLMLFLGIDEVVQIHEGLTTVLRSFNVNDLQGFAKYQWVIPYTLLALFVGVYFFRFLMQINPYTRNLMILSGGIFVGAALGFEILEGWYDSNFTSHDLNYEIMVTVEELLEMVGIAIFIYALTDYLKKKHHHINISLK